MSHEKAIKKYFLGIYDDEDRLLHATTYLRQAGVPIFDVFTPYAVHGLDEAMGIKRSRLPYVCFLAGLMGFLMAIGFQTWVFTLDWPLNVGGKPFNSFPAFLPVGFELTVLIAGLSTVAAFFIKSRLYPGAAPTLLDLATTDNHFVLAIEKADASLDVERVEKILFLCGAIAVREGEVIA